jgi:hypothetical protein
MKPMRTKSAFAKFLFILLLGCCVPGFFKAASIEKKSISFYSYHVGTRPETSLYDSLDLKNLGLSKEAFTEAVTGYQYLKKAGNLLNRGILSIVDFSLPSFRKRLFILDLENRKLLFNTLVAHGRNSGRVIATKFSNKFRSFESSLGFYLTGESYQGQNGYSLHLLGMEQGINSNALNRGIVVHAASYVNEDIAVQYGRLGRSEGCPAIPENIHRAVIGKIKNGSCFFIYAKDKKYSMCSVILREALDSVSTFGKIF